MLILSTFDTLWSYITRHRTRHRGKNVNYNQTINPKKTHHASPLRVMIVKRIKHTMKWKFCCVGHKVLYHVQSIPQATNKVEIANIAVWIIHSVESPSMVDPQWNIWYWGSKWNLHTVCWSAVGCQWGTTSVYFGITYVCFIPSRLPVFAVEPQYLLQYFLFLSKVSFELHIQNLQKNFMLVLNLNGVCRTNID